MGHTKVFCKLRWTCQEPGCIRTLRKDKNPSGGVFHGEVE